MDKIQPDCTMCAEPLKNYRFEARQDFSDPELDPCLSWTIFAIKRNNPRSGYVVLDLCSEKEASLLTNSMNKVISEICT